MEDLQSFLFVPADSERKIASSRKYRPDAYFYDLEDAVASDKKVEARELIKRELLQAANPSVKSFVRVNCFGTSLLEEDLRTAVSAKVFGIVLPKCNHAAEIAEVHQQIARLEGEIGMLQGSVKLVLLLESAKGVASAVELARASSRTMALMFGGEDFCADMGIPRTKEGDEIAMARSLVALAARAEGLGAIDGPFTDFEDADGLFKEMQRVMRMGFTGKALIHPSQIETVHRAMMPTDAEIVSAKEIVCAFEQSGKGVIAVRGKMIDEPVVRQARRILHQAFRAGNVAV